MTITVNDILSEEIIPSTFYQNFNENITSNLNNATTLVPYIMDGIEFIIAQLYKNKTLFYSTDFNYKEKIRETNLFLNLSSPEFLQFNKLIFETIKDKVSEPKFKELFYLKILHIDNLDEQSLSFTNIKNPYIFALKDFINKHLKHSLELNIKDDNIFFNYNYLHSKLKDYNFLKIKNKHFFHLYNPIFKKLDNFVNQLFKSPDNFNFFYIEPNQRNPFGFSNKEDRLSLLAYVIANGDHNSNSKDMLNLSKIFIKEFSMYKINIETSKNILLSTPLHHFGLEPKMPPCFNEFDENLNPKHKDFEPFYFTDTPIRTPENEITKKSIKNLLKYDFKLFDDKEKLLLLTLGLTNYFLLEDTEKTNLKKLSDNLGLNSIKAFNYLYKDNSTFNSNTPYNLNLAVYILHLDNLFHYKNMSHTNLIKDLISFDPNCKIIDFYSTSVGFFNNKHINAFLENNDDSIFSQLISYCICEKYNFSFVLEHELKDKIFNETLEIKNKDGVTFADYLIKNKAPIYNELSHIFQLQKNKLFNASDKIIESLETTNQRIKQFASSNDNVIAPILEHCLIKKQQYTITDLCKMVSFNTIANTNNIGEFEIFLNYKIYKYSEDLSTIKKLEEAVDLLNNYQEAKEEIIEKSNNYKKDSNLEYLLSAFNIISVYKSPIETTKNLVEQAFSETLTFLNKSIFNKDLEISQNKPSIRPKIRKF